MNHAPRITPPAVRAGVICSLLILAILAFMLGGCAHPNTPPPAKSEPIGLDAVRPDSTLAVLHNQVDSVAVACPRTLLDKLLRRPAKSCTVPLTEAHRAINIGRKSTVSVYYGPATVTTTTVGKKATAATAAGASVVLAGKKSTAVVADSGAHVGIVGSGIAQAGNGNTATMPAPVPELTAWQKFKAGLAKLKWPLAGLGTIVAIVGGIYLFAPTSAAGTWLVAALRRKKSTENQA